VEPAKLRRFSSFSVDAANQCIWRQDRRVQLPPKAFAVLQYLIDHPGRIVTKDELLRAVWSGTFVQDAVLKSCILDVRKALGDDPKNPRCIATIHRRGYRFDDIESAPQTTRADPHSLAPTIVGRIKELERLRSLWGQAVDGNRQLVFITGEPGIGKTTLIARFLSELTHVGPHAVLCGHCVEHLGATEAYYPILEALGRGLRNGAVPNLLEVLRQYAPTWLLQMPGSVSPEERRALARDSIGTTPQRMLRELSEGLEALVAEQTLILVVEDVHWSDTSTLDLISWLGARTERASLFAIASYRPIDAIFTNHPIMAIKQTLSARARCVEIALEHLNVEHVSDILAHRFPGHRFPECFTNQVHDRSAGNPLFLHQLLDSAFARGLITNEGGTWRLSTPEQGGRIGPPETLLETIESRIEKLTGEEQTVLAQASVVGMRFPVSLIARDELPAPGSVEACCRRLARRNLFIRSTGRSITEDGTKESEYEFLHAVYRDSLYQRLAPAVRMKLHHTVGEEIERRSHNCLGDVAADLALHFEKSRDNGRAITYLRLAARRCASRHAFPEATGSLTRALTLAESLNEPVRSATNLELLEQLGLLFRLSGQLPASLREFGRMNELAASVGNAEGQLRAQLWLAGVASFVDRNGCLKAAAQALELSNGAVGPDLSCNARGQVAYWNLLFRGWHDADATASASALEAARRGSDLAPLAWHSSRHAFFQALASRYRDACRTADEGVRAATEIDSLFDYSMSNYFQAWALLHVGEWGQMRALLDSAIERAKRNGNDLWVLLFGLLQAFLHIQAFSFSRAHELCIEHLDRARALQHPLSIQMSQILLGLACLGVNDLEGARRNFDAIRAWQAQERILMDWIWELPLALGVTELQLARRDLESARKESDHFLSSASTTAERTWTALARYSRARVAFAGGDGAMALAEISAGLASISGIEAPLAEWRLHALGDVVEPGGRHRANACSVIHQIANSLPGNDPLRISFLSGAAAPGGGQLAR
jgi:DNA-binding winged helix-turn-helix (wHTH) protein